MAKILVCLHDFPPHRYVGGELMTKRLLEELAARGHWVNVYAHEVQASYVIDGIFVHPLSSLTRKKVRTCDVYISHPEVHYYGSHHTIAAAIPYIGIVHNTNGKTMRNLQRREPHIVVTSSYNTAQQLPQQLRRKQVKVLYPPITNYQPLDTPGDYITHINMSEAKGFAIFESLVMAHPSYRFMAVKGGHGMQSSFAAPNMAIKPPTHDMGDIYRDMKILIHPSISESYGMVLAEATIHGIPSVINQLPTSHEVMGLAGIYPATMQEWIDAVKQLNTDKWFYADKRQEALERGEYLRHQSHATLEEWVNIVESF